MKKLNKYLLLLATAVFTFTACEKQVERDPSPVAPANALAFKESKISVEINPVKAPLEYALTVVRSTTDAEMTAKISIKEGDSEVINVPASVTFAKDAAEAEVLLTFPNAQLDSTYTIVVEVASDNQSPYLDGAAQCSFTVTIATWEPAGKTAIVFDGIVNVFYATGNPGWYVPYLRKDNADGSFDIRLLNPYTILPEYKDGDYDSPIADQFGLFGGYPYNYPEDVDSEGTYNMDIHVDKDGNATFDAFLLGMTWSYGAFAGAHATDKGMGVWDPTLQCITFPGGSVACSMSGYKDGAFFLGSEPLIVYLDAVSYQNDHLSISDFNAADINWEEVESEVNLFESTIFNFVNEEQKLFKAVNPLADNPKSPYINLYCLKDAYAAGGNLAFYWDGEDGELKVPVPQNTKLSFMQQDLYIVDAAAEVETKDVKGTAVKVFTFNIVVATKAGKLVGTYTETFSQANEAIVFEKSDFLGFFAIADSETTEHIEISEESGELFILGVTYADTIWCGFDEATGVLSIGAQKLDSLFGVYDITLYTIADGDLSAEATVDLAFGLTGVAKITATSEANGFVLYSRVAGGAVHGFEDFTLTPEDAPAAAPAKAQAINGTREFKRNTVRRTNTPSVSHLSIQNVNYRRTLRSSVAR